MLIIDGTITSDITTFLKRLHEETDVRDIITYTEWLNTHADNHDNCLCIPHGIIYMRISPAIAHARITKQDLPENASITLQELEYHYEHQEKLFIEQRHLSPYLHNLPLLVLNGNVDFKTDFSQFYNHLFYIKKFLKDIEDKKAMAQGTYEKKPHRHCC